MLFKVMASLITFYELPILICSHVKQVLGYQTVELNISLIEISVYI